ncbi:MAG TPA: DUF3450 family protein [Oceanipulchritudo sp.]|nr:DUF3450 family protein [Oceanipulchritudo sp.]
MYSIKARLGMSLIGAVCVPVVMSVGAPLEETVSTLEQWVETERRIADEAARWEADKDSTENLIEIYKEEIGTLEEIIEAAEEDTSAAEERRSGLMEQDREVKGLEAEVEKTIMAAEKNIKNLEILLPQPLREELSPLFNSLPENPEESTLPIGQRVQPIVAILTQIQKFNQVVTVVEGFREFEEGRTVQTEKIFFGIGAAYYVDQADEHAGMGVLTEEGWTWRDDNSLVPAIRSFIDIYRGTEQASYVEVPVTIN